MTTSGASDGAVSGATRTWLRAEGFIALLISILLHWNSGGRWWLFVVLFLVPDVSMLGYLVLPQVGRTSYTLSIVMYCHSRWRLPRSQLTVFESCHSYASGRRTSAWIASSVTG
jgi:hypothetical protein